jgi:hypothetical protein
VPLEP